MSNLSKELHKNWLHNIKKKCYIRMKNIIQAKNIFKTLWQLYFSDTYIRGAYDKFPDFFRMGTFVDSTHMKL